MNEPFDPLEAELGALKPQLSSAELKQRIANSLVTSGLAPANTWSHRIWRSSVAIGGLVAACLAAGLLLRTTPVGKPEIDGPLAPLQLPLAAAFDDALPTVWTYRRALARPPHELDALFDKHVARASPSGGLTPSHLFIQFDPQQLSLGEL